MSCGIVTFKPFRLLRLSSFVSLWHLLMINKKICGNKINGKNIKKPIEIQPALNILQLNRYGNYTHFVLRISPDAINSVCILNASDNIRFVCIRLLPNLTKSHNNCL